MEIPAVIREKASQMKVKELEDYVLKVNKLLHGMKPGDSLVIDKITKSDTRELFIETVKWYMRLHSDTYQEGLSFSGGYEKLRKNDLAWASTSLSNQEKTA